MFALTGHFGVRGVASLAAMESAASVLGSDPTVPQAIERQPDRGPYGVLPPRKELRMAGVPRQALPSDTAAHKNRGILAALPGIPTEQRGQKGLPSGDCLDAELRGHGGAFRPSGHN